MTASLTFRVDARGASTQLRFGADRLVVAGWAGRDAAALAHHVAELAALGVAPPSRTPLFYRAAPALLTQAGRVEVLGPGTSGEVEPLLLVAGGELLVGVGSDHTDRDAEAWSVPHSKQLCAKPVAPTLWRWDDISDHWDSLVLRSSVPAAGGGWTPYQDGAVAALRRPDELLALAAESGADAGAGAEAGPGTAMLCGTLPAIGGIRPAEAFRMELHDPVLGRTIRHAYAVSVLPIVS